MNRLSSLLLLCLFAAPVAAQGFDPELEEQVRAISVELRCLVCQNQTIADSDAPLAHDLRREVREMLQAGASPQQIREFMVQRYGDFVLYRPPVQPYTWMLWFGPALFVALGLWVLMRSLRARDHTSDEKEFNS